MAYPVADSYSAASGKNIYAGQLGPPDWLPSTGIMSRVSLNTMSSVFDTGNPDGRLRGSQFILDAWCMTLFCDDWGTLGGILCFGGGHQNYLGNEVYMYDIATQLFSRISNATPIPIQSQDYDTVAGNKDGIPSAFPNLWGEYWTSEARDAVIVGKCAPPHTYCNLVHVRAADVGNTHGWAVLMGGFSFQPHYIDLDNPSNGWERLGGTFKDVRSDGVGQNYGCAIYDTLRRRVVGFPFDDRSMSYGYTLAVPSGVLGQFSQNFVNSYYAAGFHDTSTDLYIITKFQEVGGVWDIVLHDPATNAKTAITHTGTRPVGVGTLDFDQTRRQLVAWVGNNNDPDLYICQLPLNPKTQAWVWTKVDYANTSAIVQPQGTEAIMYRRLHHVPKLDAYMIVTRVDGAVQCWKP